MTGWKQSYDETAIQNKNMTEKGIMIMKKMNKIFALLITMVMVLSMSVTAFAGSITITRDESYDGSTGRTYTAYKVLDADTSLSGSNTQEDKQPDYGTTTGPIAYTMALNSPWVTVLWDTAKDVATTGQIWFDVSLAADGSKYVVTPIGTLTDSVASAIAAFLNTNKPASAVGTSITPGTEASVDNGYYLLVASDGATNLTLVTTDISIVEKNTYIKTTKTTSETSYSIGDTVEYTATVEVPSDASQTAPIVLHDEMDEVLAFKKDVAATIDGDAFTAFTVTSTGLEDDCTFEISIPVTTEILGKTIIFTYTAELTSAAGSPDTGFVNELFGEKNGYKSNPDQPKVYTFDFDFSKTFVGSSDTNLTATFELRTDADDASTAINFIAGSTTGSYVKADSDDKGVSTSIISANNAKINIEGLKAGTYYLVEKTTSTGYNLLDAAVAVVITDTTTNGVPSHTVTVAGQTSTETAPVAIQNNQGTLLPSTGGMGTTILYVVGGILVAAAVVLLFVKRRVEEK